MSLADELWRKYERDDWAGEEPFKAALREYGEAVRAGAVKECKDNGDLISIGKAASYTCAAAISRMPLP